MEESDTGDNLSIEVSLLAAIRLTIILNSRLTQHFSLPVYMYRWEEFWEFFWGKSVGFTISVERLWKQIIPHPSLYTYLWDDSIIAAQNIQ